MKPKTKAKRKTKQKQTLTNEPNPLTMILNGNIDFDKVSKMRDTKIDDWLVKCSMNPDMDLDLEWRRLNKINWSDIDFDLDNIDLTNDHLDIGHDYNRMIEIELDLGGIDVSQHGHALRKLKRLRASRITDWIVKDKVENMDKLEMKPLALNICEIDTKGLDVDAVLSKTQNLSLKSVLNVDSPPPPRTEST